MILIVDAGIIAFLLVLVFLAVSTGATEVTKWIVNHLWVFISIGFAKCLLNFLNKAYSLKERWKFFAIDIVKTALILTHIILFLNTLLESLSSSSSYILGVIQFALELIFAGLIFVLLPLHIYSYCDILILESEKTLSIYKMGFVSIMVTLTAMGMWYQFSNPEKPDPDKLRPIISYSYDSVSANELVASVKMQRKGDNRGLQNVTMHPFKTDGKKITPDIFTLDNDENKIYLLINFTLNSKLTHVIYNVEGINNNYFEHYAASSNGSNAESLQNYQDDIFNDGKSYVCHMAGLKKGQYFQFEFTFCSEDGTTTSFSCFIHIK